jgi:type VI secretion system protein ImpC
VAFVKGTKSMSELLDSILQEGNLASDAEPAQGLGIVQEFVERVAVDAEASPKGVGVRINEAIAQLDGEISRQLSAVMSHPDFQKLEATWRGLSFLIHNTETGTRLKLRVFPAAMAELQKDLSRAVEFDQSQLFKKLYEDEYGTFGGTPYSMIIVDHEFTQTNQDMDFLENLASVAAAAHAPMISSASPRMFGMGSFTQLGNPRDMAKVFESSDYVKWRSFRDSEDSRYVTLTLPRILLRLPYGPDGKAVEELNYIEDVDGKDHDKYLWGNAAWALAQRVTNAFSLYGWTAAIRGVEGGGLVEGLPAHTFRTDEGDVALKCPTEVAITDRREKEISDLGFLSLVHCKGTDTAAFFGGQTVNQPKTYNTDSANANAMLSARLPYIFAASRFAHYFKVMLRDKIGSFQTADQIETYLQTWISDYILLDDNASQRAKAEFPLREARVDVREVPGTPGAFTAVAFLRPHFQLEEISASIRLVASLPPAAA